MSKGIHQYCFFSTIAAALLLLFLPSCKTGVTKKYNDQFVLLDVEGYKTNGDLLSPFKGWKKNKNWQDPDVIIGGIIDFNKSHVIKSTDGLTFVSSREINGVSKAKDLMDDYSCYLVDNIIGEYALHQYITNVTDVQKPQAETDSISVANSQCGKFLIFAVKHSDYRRIVGKSLNRIADDATLRFAFNVNSLFQKQ